MEDKINQLTAIINIQQDNKNRSKIYYSDFFIIKTYINQSYSYKKQLNLLWL